MRDQRLEGWLGCISPLHCCGSDILELLLQEYLRTGGLSAGLDKREMRTIRGKRFRLRRMLVIGELV